MFINIIIVLLALTVSQNLANADVIVDVTKHGAKGDGKTDDSQAFQAAWRAVCHVSSRHSSPVLLIPGWGRFVLHPTAFQGPCHSHSVTVKVQGHVIAREQEGRHWIIFREVDNLVIEGSGSFDGQGQRWWPERNEVEGEGLEKKFDDYKNKKPGKKPGGDQEHLTGERPTTLAFFSCKHLRVYQISSFNSAKNHITISQCDDVVISNIHLKSPQHSPNTDGIDITRSSSITIKDSHIETGDDCIELNSGTSYVNISNVACGPGHGISIGSFKRREANVEKVHVRGCTFTGTANGARIKTFPDGLGGYVRSITFEGITLNNVENPIIIDQEYGQNLVTGAGNGGYQISDVKFIGFRGTCAGEEAIVLKCGYSGCTDIYLRDVKIEGARGQPVRAVCRNAHGRAELTSPRVRCLTGGLGGGDGDYGGNVIC